MCQVVDGVCIGSSDGASYTLSFKKIKFPGGTNRPMREQSQYLMNSGKKKDPKLGLKFATVHDSMFSRSRKQLL